VLGLLGQAGQHQQRRVSPPVQPVSHLVLRASLVLFTRLTLYRHAV
jgi:hypothetical protein